VAAPLTNCTTAEHQATICFCSQKVKLAIHKCGGLLYKGVLLLHGNVFSHSVAGNAEAIRWLKSALSQNPM